MNLNFKAIMFGAVAGAGLVIADYAMAQDANVNLGVFDESKPIKIEIERNLPNNEQFIISREFNDLEDLLMWFENKVDNEGCDPYVDKVILFPKGE
jgi:hypothetical protein